MIAGVGLGDNPIFWGGKEAEEGEAQVGLVSSATRTPGNPHQGPSSNPIISLKLSESGRNKSG